MMPLPHRLPRSDIGWQDPPWATRAEPPRDAFQYQTMLTANLLPRLPSSDGITDSTAAQNSSEITPIRVTGQSSLVNAFHSGDTP